MTEDRDPERAPESFRFEARVGRADRPPLALTAIVVAFVLLAIAKPWGGEVSPTGGSAAPTPRAPRASAMTAVPTRAPATPAASQDGAEAVGAICLEPGSWRTATIETWRDQTVRVWRALDPIAASGPDDPAIPIVPAVGGSIPAIGFCAPGIGPDRPVGPVEVSAWRLDSGEPREIDLRRIEPAGVASAFGGLYGPPDDDMPGSWSDGVVVFRLADAGADVERWFGIEVRGVSGSGRGSPAP